MNDRYADWDAAYVLGALSPVERREYEQHLSTCPACRDSVAELAALPPVLAGVGIEEVASASDRSAGPGPAVLAGMLRTARQRRRRLVAMLSAAAAAVVLAIAGAALGLSGALSPQSARAVEVTLAAEADAPITAEVVLQPRRWGTSVTTHCEHADPVAGEEGPGGSGETGEESGEYGGGALYGLFVTDTSGEATMVSSWHADDDADILAEGATDLSISEMATLDIRDIDSGAVVLSAAVPR